MNCKWQKVIHFLAAALTGVDGDVQLHVWCISPLTVGRINEGEVFAVAAGQRLCKVLDGACLCALIQFVTAYGRYEYQ